MNIKHALVVACLGVLVASCGEAPTRVEEEPQITIFYPPLPEKPRLQYLTHISIERDLKAERASDFRKFLIGADQVRAWLVRPYSVAHSPGVIWVADRGRGEIVRIDLKAQRMEALRTVQPGTFQDPGAIAVAPDGYLFVADLKLERIIALDPRGIPVRSYGEDGQFKPTDVAATEDRIYVADIRDNEVEVIDRASGEVIQRIGADEDAEGGLYRPAFIDLDAEGNLFVTDTFNFRVQVYDPEGNHLRSIGKLGDRPGYFARPKGLAVDRNDYLYVADAAFENIQIFDGRTGDVLLFFGTNGEGPGGTYLPVAVDIDYQNLEYFQRFVDPRFRLRYLIYVGNQSGRQRINVYGFGDWKGPKLN